MTVVKTIAASWEKKNCLFDTMRYCRQVSPGFPESDYSTVSMHCELGIALCLKLKYIVFCNETKESQSRCRHIAHEHSKEFRVLEKLMHLRHIVKKKKKKFKHVLEEAINSCFET